MRVIVDTSVWSLALRRRKAKPTNETEALTGLVRDGRVSLLGTVRQEILSGIRDIKQFNRLQIALSAFPDEPVETENFIEAARVCNQCISSGIVVGNTDCLIAAVALRRNLEILTTDKDFTFISKIMPIRLFQI